MELLRITLIVLSVLTLFLAFDCYCKKVINSKQNKVIQAKENEEVNEIKQVDDPIHNKMVLDQLEEYTNKINIPNYTENNISAGTATFHPITVEDYN